MIIETMTTLEFQEGLELTRTVIVPLGAIEEHGPHLPMNTDIYHAYEISKRVSEMVSVFVAPPLNFGVCRSTADFPGTIGIRPETLKALISDVVGALYGHGLMDFILYSGHAGMNHVAAILDAADEMMKRFDDISFAVLTDMELTDIDFFDLVETQGDSHAGEIETSIIMSLAPDLVGELPDADYPRFPRPRLVRDTGKYWKSGVWGNPKNASRVKGDKMVDILVRNLKALVEKIANQVRE